jgi:hypothetical protein
MSTRSRHTSSPTLQGEGVSPSTSFFESFLVPLVNCSTRLYISTTRKSESSELTVHISPHNMCVVVCTERMPAALTVPFPQVKTATVLLLSDGLRPPSLE